MNSFALGRLPLWVAAAWTMTHFLWIGAAIALLAGLIRWAIRRRSPELRYAVSLALFAILALAPAALLGWKLTLGATSAAGFAAETVEARNGEATAIPGERLRHVLHADEMPWSADAKHSVNGGKPARIDQKELPQVLVTRAEFDAYQSLAGAAVRKFPLPQSAAANNPTKLTFWNRAAAVIRSGLNLADRWATRCLPGIWLVGFPATSCWLLVGLAGGERLRRRCRVVEDRLVQSLSWRLQTLLNLSGTVIVGVSDRVATPILVGIFRPLILLPAAAVSRWTPEQLELILLHELAHVRRWDNAVNLLQRLTEAVLFFHPAVWWLSNRIRLEREHCCDAIVLAHGGSRRTYAETLAQIAIPEFRPQWAFGSSAGTQLAARIRQILKQEDEPMQVSRLVPVVVLATCVGVVGLAMASGKSEPSSPAAETAQDEKVATGRLAPETTKRSAATSHAQPPVPEQLRYDDLPFGAWRGRLKTELSPEARDKAIRAMGRFGSHRSYTQEAIVAIVAALKSEPLQHNDPGDQKVEHAATWSFLRIGDPAIPALVELQKDADVEIRRFVIETLWSWPFNRPTENGKVVDALVRASRDPEFWIRTKAIDSLKRLSEDRTYASVLLRVATERLKDDHPQIRREAATILAGFGREAEIAIPALLNAMNDLRNREPKTRDYAVLSRVIHALLEVGGNADTIVPSLIEALQKTPDDSRSQVTCATAIGHFGPKAAAAVPALMEALSRAEHSFNTIDWRKGSDGHVELQLEAVCNALAQIGPPARAAAPLLENLLMTWRTGHRPVTQQLYEAVEGALTKIEPQKHQRRDNAPIPAAPTVVPAPAHT